MLCTGEGSLLAVPIPPHRLLKTSVCTCSEQLEFIGGADQEEPADRAILIERRIGKLRAAAVGLQVDGGGESKRFVIDPCTCRWSFT